MIEKHLPRRVGNAQIVTSLINAKKKIVTIARRSRMKTLNEVIKAFEQCKDDKCYECAYHEKVHTNSCITKRNNDAFYYLKILKAKSEEPPIGEPPDYISLDFHRLAEMIGEPVYVKDSGCKGHWEIVMGVRKTVDGEDICFRGCNQWRRIGKDIYRTKEGAEQ